VRPPLAPDELEARLRRVGAERYHDKHAFHRLMNEGKLTRGQLQAWALNRYYYQAMIPMKDAAILSRMQDADLRRIWRQRIIDHDGDSGDEGGIARWTALTDGLGLERTYVLSTAGILPATRFAVDAYLHFVRDRSLLEAIASSLTELFARSTIDERLAAMLSRYEFLNRELLSYFDRRLAQAPRDADFALAYVKREARTPEQQEAVIAALEFKCAVLWCQLDGLYLSYVSPGLIPPGAFKPESA
jgi:pyrroloquinoline quinone biosynthesis protein D